MSGERGWEIQEVDPSEMEMEVVSVYNSDGTIHLFKGKFVIELTKWEIGEWEKHGYRVVRVEEC